MLRPNAFVSSNKRIGVSTFWFRSFGELESQEEFYASETPFRSSTKLEASHAELGASHAELETFHAKHHKIIKLEASHAKLESMQDEGLVFEAFDFDMS